MRFVFPALLLVAISLTPSLSAFAAAGTGDPGCAKNFTVLRKGPGSTFAISWRVARYMPFFRFESKNGWVRVEDMDGETHWAQARDLTSTYGCVVVKATLATLRKDPSISAPTSDLKTLDRYTPLKKIEVQGEWVKIEDETGRKAWIHESNIWKPMKLQTLKF